MVREAAAPGSACALPGWPRQARISGITVIKARLTLSAALLALAAIGGSAATPLEHTASAPAASAAKPQRIVSLNLCTDQLLLQMVDPQRIRAVSYLARDPRSSGMVKQAELVPETSGHAEQVIAMNPDLVLAGTFSTRKTVAILRKLGYRVIEFDPASDFADIIGNIHEMARAVGEPARGEAMGAQIERRLASLPHLPAVRPVYANYDANGFTSGDGALVTSVANSAGFDTLGQRLGLAGSPQISLEQMLISQPDLIDLGDDFTAPSLATEMFDHPALQALMRERQTIALPAKYTACGTMQTLHALDALVDARGTMP